MATVYKDWYTEELFKCRPRAGSWERRLLVDFEYMVDCFNRFLPENTVSIIYNFIIQYFLFDLCNS